MTTKKQFAGHEWRYEPSARGTRNHDARGSFQSIRYGELAFTKSGACSMTGDGAGGKMILASVIWCVIPMVMVVQVLMRKFVITSRKWHL